MTGPSREEIERALELARDKFGARDHFLAENNAHERAMTFKFGAYLQEALPDLDIDCEYNRLGFDGKTAKRVPKRYFKRLAEDERDETYIYPDIIIHERSEKKNYAVIEAKWAGSDQAYDEVKLAILGTDDRYNYERAFLLTFSGEAPYVKWDEVPRDAMEAILQQALKRNA